MSNSSRTVPPEQLPSEDLHPPPMPVINLGHLLEPTTRSCMVEDIAKACRDLGYFQVINHGISQSIMDGAVEAASDFFKLPSEVKEEFASDDLRQPVRYDTSSKDGISMSRAFLKHYAHPLSDWVQYWPEDPAIILLTSCRGLEVVDRNSNSWKVVQQLPHALHVHVGDHMEVLSNGRIKTVVHRALLNPEEERISIASINGFALHEKVSSAKELVNEQNPKKYKESSFNDFLDHLTRNMDKKHMNFLESLRI